MIPNKVTYIYIYVYVLVVITVVLLGRKIFIPLNRRESDRIRSNYRDIIREANNRIL